MKSEWKLNKLVDVCSLINGRAYRKPELLNEGKYPVLRVGNFFTSNHWYYSDLELGADKYCDHGDLLYAWSASFGPRIWEGEKTIYHYHIWKVQPKDNLIDKRFLFLWFLWDMESIKEAQGTGTTMIHVSKGSMENRDIRIPPLNEQRRIVEILDEAFEAIAKAKASAERNLESALALFASYLNSLFTKPREGWTEKTLGDVCNFVGGSQPPKAVFTKSRSKDSVRLIQIRDYKSDKHLVYIPRTLAKRYCSTDDIMIGRYGPPIFQILRGLEGAYNVALMKAIPNEALISRDFLYYFLKNSALLQYVIYHSDRAAGQCGLTKETLEPYPISYPSLNEQTKIVETIIALELETKRLEALYQKKLDALDNLKKSLLNKAFSGELTASKPRSLVLSSRDRDSNLLKLHAAILAIAYELHEKHKQENYFGHVKAEKISHMIESYTGIDLGRNPIKDAAGPNDFPHLRAVDYYAKKSRYFHFKKTDSRYKFLKRKKFNELVTETRKALGSQLLKVEQLIKAMLPMDKAKAEIFATVYAAWNNLLLQKEVVTDEKIVFEARENWHEDKLKIPRERFFKAIEWMKKNKFIPNGTGKMVLAKKLK